MPRDAWGDNCIAYHEALKSYPQIRSCAERFSDLYWLFTGEFSGDVFAPAVGRKSRGAIRMNFNEAQALFDAVQNSAGNILEIGRRFGGSTVLINVAANRRLVVSVDNCPAHMDICEAYFQTCAPKPMLLIQDSRIRLEIPFGCVFIDGDHSLAGVLADTIVHWPTIVPQGIVIYHDAVAGAFGSREGVTAVAETLLRERCVDVVSSADSLIVFRKIMELPIDFGTRCGYLPQSGPPEMA